MNAIIENSQEEIEEPSDLSDLTPSSYLCDGKGNGLFLLNGERPNLFPEHKLLNGEVANNQQSRLPGKKKCIQKKIYPI